MKYIKPGYLLLCCKQAVIILYALLAPAAAFAQHDMTIHGRVADEKNRPVVFASARIEETGAGAYTNEKGAFSIPIPKAKFDSVTLIISYVDKVTIHRVIPYKDLAKPLFIRMQEQSLTLKDVQVTAVREKQHSVSSIIFDREAIMQSQAFSLADILNRLPGKLTQAPALQQPQTLKIRTAAAPDGYRKGRGSTLQYPLPARRRQLSAGSDQRNELFRGGAEPGAGAIRSTARPRSAL